MPRTAPSPRTVNHYAGSTVVKAAPTKVAVLSTGQADALLTLGVTPSDSTAARKTTAVPTYLSNAFPAQKSALNTMADLGSRTSPDIESIAKMKPDLILVNKAGKNSDELYKSLTKIAPTVVTQGTGTHWKEDFLLVADAVGKRQQAEKWLTDYQKDAADYGASVSNKPTISLLRRNDGTQRVFGVASFAGSVAQDAGLTRPSSQLFSKKVSQDISDENIDKADGGELFYGIQSGGKASDLTSLPLWPSLKAVSEKKAVEVDDDMFFLNAGPTAARGVLDALKKQIG